MRPEHYDYLLGKAVEAMAQADADIARLHAEIAELKRRPSRPARAVKKKSSA